MCKCMYLHTHGCTQHVNARVYKSEWECMHTHVYPFFFLEMAARVYTVYMPVSLLLMYVYACACMYMPSCVDLYVPACANPSGIELSINMHVSIFMRPHVHECAFVDECGDWGRGFSVCLLANMVHNKWEKTIRQGLEISNLRSTLAHCCPGLSQNSWNYGDFLGWWGRFLGFSFLEEIVEPHCSHKKKETLQNKKL